MPELQTARPSVAPPHTPPRSATDLFGDPIDAHPPWLNPTAFSDSNFDPESYISDLRTFVPFDTLRWELRSYLSSLNRELVDLINRDYSDFVSLSTKLVDIDASVVRMRAPLFEMKEKILVFRAAVESSLVALKSRLNQRSDASAARELLELLLDAFHIVSKVEKLIMELPSVPVDWSSGTLTSETKDRLSNGISIHYSENGTGPRETQSMLLERIASEVNRLKFYIAHAQNMPFIENMKKRMQSASSLLGTSLGHCFMDALKHRDAGAIYNCLRAYVAIDNTGSAEEIFRTTVVAPFVEKVILHGSSEVVNGETEGTLEQDYTKIKKYVEDECKFLLEISSTDNSGLQVFNFLANSILKEVLSAIQRGKPGAFSPGRPTEFLKNYKASLDFLSHLEGYQHSQAAVAKFRSETVYIEFMKQWNVGVYFSLRFQEIAGALDSALMVTILTPIQSSPSDSKRSENLSLRQSIALLGCMRSCWSEDIFVLSCSDKFLRLTLQLISRYSHWLSSGLAARKSGKVGINAGSEWAINAAPDDLIYIISDLDNLVDEIGGKFPKHVVELLSSCSVEVHELVKKSLSHGAKSLKDLLPLVIKSVVDTFTQKAEEDLKQLKGIAATYRMTNKPLPVRHSPYVSAVLRPLKSFLDSERAATYLTDEIRHQLLQHAAFEITDRYYECAKELVDMVRKTETSLQKIRMGAQKRAGASLDVSETNVSDSDKVCMQLFLDNQEYGRNLAALGIDAVNIPAYCRLWNLVAPPDRQNSISF